MHVRPTRLDDAAEFGRCAIAGGAMVAIHDTIGLHPVEMLAPYQRTAP